MALPRYATQTGALKTSITVGLAVVCAGILGFLISGTIGTRPAAALPSFAIQTGQPCAACHVGSFGPQLKPYGRDFKLHGYVASDGKTDHGLPLSFTTQATFTHTRAPQPDGAAPGFKPNDNLAINEVSLYYAGRITPEIGAFIELSYDGVAQKGNVGAVDIRRAGEGQLLEKDLLWGFTANNGPTVTDPWNSTPTWGFPYNASALVPTPTASTLIDGGLSERVAGAGAYMLWDDLVYAEFDLYKGLNAPALRAFGQGLPDEGNRATSLIPYGRLALIRDWGKHHAQIGAYGLFGKVVPGDGQTFGLENRVTDLALDANYQFILEPSKVTSDMLSAHATFIHEDSSTDSAGAALFDTLQHRLDTFRVDVSYSFAATFTPSIQYFQTTGTADLAYWGTSSGSPNSSGMIYELAYVPWGKPDSPFPNVNLRLAVQYVDYFRFDGETANAHDNSHFFFSLWAAMKF